MKNWFALVVITFLVLAGIPAHAQLSKPFSEQEYPFFVGGHFFQSNYEVFFHSLLESNTTGVVPWQLTAGGNLFPRLALQIGYTYRHEEDHLDPSYTGTNLAGQFISGSSEDERWTHCVPALARYAVIGFPKHRLQTGLLLGFTLLHTRAFAAAESRIDNYVVSRSSTDVKATQGYISGGLGFRYLFGHHLEGILDWTYSRNFRQASPDVHFQATGNEYGLTRALSLGLRYRFALKKKAAGT